jgi:hypothetical protein
MGAAADKVWAIVSGLPSGKREQRGQMALQAYIDDSGSEPRDPFFVLGGFVTQADDSVAFSNEWGALLRSVSHQSQASPVTTISTRRLPHCEQTSRRRHSGTGVSGPYQHACSAGSGSLR